MAQGLMMGNRAGRQREGTGRAGLEEGQRDRERGREVDGEGWIEENGEREGEGGEQGRKEGREGGLLL